MSAAINSHNAVAALTMMYGEYLSDYERRVQQLAKQLGDEQKGRAEMAQQLVKLKAENDNIRRRYEQVVGSANAQANEERMASVERGGDESPLGSGSVPLASGATGEGDRGA